MKILVADDNPAILDALKIMLETQGYDVETTEDGVNAQTVTKPFPDLLLLDIWMSGMDGSDICRALKSDDATKNIPIILISATKDIEQIAKNAGADDFLAKPFDMQSLLTMISKHIKV